MNELKCIRICVRRRIRLSRLLVLVRAELEKCVVFSFISLENACSEETAKFPSSEQSV